MTTITHAQRAAALAAAQDAPDAAAALDEIARIWGVTLPEPEPSEEMERIADEIVRSLPCSGLLQWTEKDLKRAALAALQFAAEKAREAPSMALLDSVKADELISRSAFLASIGAGHAR